MFPNIEIEGFIDDLYSGDKYKGKSVHRSEELSKLKAEGSCIIICHFDKDIKADYLSERGYKYKESYLFADDFFSSLDDENLIINPDNKKVVIWGTGKNSAYFSGYFTYFKPEFYIDSNKSREKYFGKDVLTPDDIENWNNYYVIIAVQKDEDISAYLQRKGFIEGTDYINSNRIISLPSEMLRATIYDRHQYNLNCDTPLNHMEYLTDGDIFCCCSTFMRAIGNSEDGGINGVWKSMRHKVICLSVQNHTYTFCDKAMCPLLFGKETNNEVSSVDSNYRIMQEVPEVCAIGYDYSCNLRCETCRDHLRIAYGTSCKKMISM